MDLSIIKKLSLIVISTTLLLTGCVEEESKVELNVSVASSLKESMLEIEKKYEQENKGIDIILNFGGSGALAQQITQGAPCDVFISASKVFMDELKAKGSLMDKNYELLLENKLVLASKSKNINSLDSLKDDSIKKIAIGETKSVPAGQYANEVLENYNIKKNVEEKLVYAKDVKEVLTWVESGNVEAGFVYYTDVINKKDLNIYEIEPALYSCITYPISVVNGSKKEYEAKLFEAYLLSDECKSIFVEDGYIK